MGAYDGSNCDDPRRKVFSLGSLVAPILEKYIVANYAYSSPLRLICMAQCYNTIFPAQVIVRYFDFR